MHLSLSCALALSFWLSFVLSAPDLDPDWCGVVACSVEGTDSIGCGTFLEMSGLVITAAHLLVDYDCEDVFPYQVSQRASGYFTLKPPRGDTIVARVVAISLAADLMLLAPVLGARPRGIGRSLDVLNRCIATFHDRLWERAELSDFRDEFYLRRRRVPSRSGALAGNVKDVRYTFDERTGDFVVIMAQEPVPPFLSSLSRSRGGLSVPSMQSTSHSASASASAASAAASAASAASAAAAGVLPSSTSIPAAASTSSSKTPQKRGPSSSSPASPSSSTHGKRMATSASAVSASSTSTTSLSTSAIGPTYTVPSSSSAAASSSSFSGAPTVAIGFKLADKDPTPLASVRLASVRSYSAKQRLLSQVAVLAMGNTDRRPHVEVFWATGTVSSTSLECPILADIMTHPGDSGGPVLNLRYELVGVHFARFRPNRHLPGWSRFVPVSYIRQWLGRVAAMWDQLLP